MDPILFVAAGALIGAAIAWSRAEEPPEDLPEDREPPEYVPWEDEQPDDYDEDND